VAVVEPVAVVEQVAMVQPAPVAKPVAVVEPVAVEVATPRVVAEERLVHREAAYDESIEEDRPASAWKKVLGALLLIAVLAGIVLVAWPYLQRLSGRMRDLPAVQTETQSAAAGGGSTAGAGDGSAAAAPVAGTKEVGDVPSAGSADKEAQGMAEADPEIWLQGWAEALRGSDAALQASYYADRLDRYFLRSDVSRDAVMADKEAAIAQRKGLWTVRVEDVVVTQRTETTARILLVKHIVKEPGEDGVSEERLRTRLWLKRIDGRWQITSEQTLF
jgi:hypothetical protein